MLVPLAASPISAMIDLDCVSVKRAAALLMAMLAFFASVSGEPSSLGAYRIKFAIADPLTAVHLVCFGLGW